MYGLGQGFKWLLQGSDDPAWGGGLPRPKMKISVHVLSEIFKKVHENAVLRFLQAQKNFLGVGKHQKWDGGPDHHQPPLI